MDPSNATPKRKQQETLNYMSVVIASEIALVCAAVLVFIVYFKLPISYATGAILVSIVAGSVFAWRNIVAAEAILVFSVLAAQLVVLTYFMALLWPFVVIDLLLIAWLSSMWNVSEDMA